MNHIADLIVRREKSFLVFLQVALVTRWQAFQCGEQAKQRTSDAAGFAANQFPGVWIFLLRHQATAGGEFVGKNHVRKFLRRKDDEILSKAREMRGNSGKREKVIEREVAVADSVEAVRGDL